jgi:hypothetical protein
MSGDPVQCQCPSAWFGVVPPICPMHNPYPGRTTVGYGNYTSGVGWLTSQSPRMSDDDVERIAKRVAELLKP